MKKIKTFTKKYTRSLTKDEVKYSSGFEFKSSNIYGLPKIHKSKTIINQIKMEDTDLGLKNNTFLFTNQWYVQMSGKAMGTKMAPTYANLTLGYLE